MWAIAGSTPRPAAAAAAAAAWLGKARTSTPPQAPAGEQVAGGRAGRRARGADQPVLAASASAGIARAPRQRVPGRRHDHEPVAQERHRLEAGRVAGRARAERDVGQPIGEQAGEDLARLHLHRHLHVR